MYQYLKVVLKIGKVKEAMSQTVGVRQGDYMAPVLILFMVIAFTESHKRNKLSEWNLLSLFFYFER